MKNLSEFWKKMNIAQQLVLMVLVIGGLVFVAFQMRPSTYTVLYSNLSTEESLEIQQEITKMNVSYQAEENGETLLVDGADIPLVKAKLATLGLPYSGSPGFELFDENSIGSTRFDKEQKNKRAIIGEITKGLVQGFDYIDKAYLTLDFTEKEHFFEEESDAKASVSLDIKRGKELSINQVRAVQVFVAGAVQNLTPESVAVIDKKTGIELSSNEEMASSSSNSYDKQIEIERKVQKQIESDLVPTLSKNFGEGNFTVNVNVAIDFDEIVKNIEEYGDSVLISRKENTENSESNSTEKVQEAGTDANGTVPEYEIDENGNSTLTKQSKEEIIENFEVGKTVSTIKENPELVNINVGVTLNQAELDKRYIEEIETYLKDWKDLVALSAGILIEEDTYVNGSVLISPQEYPTENPNDVVEDAQTGEELNEEKEEQKIIVMIAVFGGLFLVLLVFFVLFISNRKQKKEALDKAKREAEEKQASLAKKGEEKEKTGKHAEMNAEEQEKEFEKEVNNYEFNDFTEEQEQLAERAKEVAGENPERTAQFIKKQINKG